MTKKLQSEAGCEVIALVAACRTLENHLRAEGPIQGAQMPKAKRKRKLQAGLEALNIQR